MKKSKVYFKPVTNQSQWNETAREVLEKFIADQDLTLEKKLTLKIHSGEPGNISFIQPSEMNGVIDFLEERNIKATFMETNTASGPRSKGENHREIAREHGFTRLPFKIADGDDGKDHVLVPIKNGKHFNECKIARLLVESDQVLVISHFKGHVMTGFGGAIKMLGIGYASSRGKTEAHAVPEIPEDETIDWSKAQLSHDEHSGKVKWNNAYVYSNVAFMERTAEYALAATKPNDIHLIYATNLVKNCDCDSKKMDPIYPDLGIFASRDPVAIDKAILDSLDQREGKSTYWGRQIFEYSDNLGLGNQEYELIEI